MSDIPSLFDLTSDYAELMSFGYTEEDSEAFMDTLEGIKGGIADKSDAYCAVMNRFMSNIEAIKTEKARLDKMQLVLENNLERMKTALTMVLETMEEAGEKPEIITPLHKIKFRNNGGKQPLAINEDAVPDSFKKVILETDKEKIRKALESGEKLDFAELKPRGRHITGIK